MNKMYVIQWKSKINGRAGRGTKQFSREEAERLVQELNQEYPQILHEVVGFQEQRQPAETEVEPVEEQSRMEAETSERRRQAPSPDSEKPSEQPSDPNHIVSVE